MRIALCISGQPRNIDRGIENILQNMKFDFDVFMHTWWDKDSNKETFKKILYDGSKDEVSSPMDNDWISHLYKSFDVKKMAIEEQIQLKVPKVLEDRKLKFSHTFGICSSLYSVYKCNELKRQYESENGFVYDWVIRTRSDFGMLDELNIDSFDNSVIYAPNDNSHRYGFNDQFAVGSSKNMDVYCDAYPKMEEIINSHKTDIFTAPYCTQPGNVGHEQIVQRNLENNEIKFELIELRNYLFRDKDKRTRVHSIEG